MDRPKHLTETFVFLVDEPGTYGDGLGGRGLSLLVQPRSDGTLGKSFVQRLRIDGKPRNRGLGPYPDVSLQEARKMAKENALRVRRHRVRRSLDRLLSGPVVHNPAAPAPVRAVLFRDACDEVIKINRTGWKPGGHPGCHRDSW